MKTILRLTIIALCGLGLAACASNQKTAEQEQENKQAPRKIYLTEDDYLADLNNEAYKTRREAKPNTESQYLFELQSETEKNVYFFDERVRPMVPGQPSERDYKNTKRLWEKPKRYTPQQYYGNGGQAADESTPDAPYASDYNFDYE